MTFEQRYTLNTKPPEPSGPDLIRYINLRLALLGCPISQTADEAGLPDIAAPLLAIHRERSRLLANYLCPADWRVQNFLNEYLYDTGLEVEVGRFKNPARNGVDKRAILSHKRSVGSVIKLLTPSTDDFSAEHNEWLNLIPQYIKELVFVVKRFYKEDWGHKWREHFSVDVINGVPGNELKCDNQKLVTTYLRVGFETDGSWRVFGLRKDFHPAAKLQMEDDITASVVVPASLVKNRNPDDESFAVKFVKNCEYRLTTAPLISRVLH